MQYRQLLAAVGATTALVALAACSGSSTGPGNADSNALVGQLSTNAAASAGQAAVSDLDETGNDASAGSYSIAAPNHAGTFASSVTPFSVGGCAQSGGEGDLRWYCPADTLTITNGIFADTLIRQRNYEFFAAGVAQSTFTSSTDSINWGGANGVPVYVAVHRPLWTGVSHRIRNHSVTDKTPSFAMDSVRTWNGNAVANDTASFQGTMWAVTIRGLAYDSTVHVVFIHPRETHPFPISGQFHRWVTWNYQANGPSTRTGTVTRHIVVTYNGTQTATLQVIGTTTLTCNLDLITGNLSNCTGGGTA